MNVGCVRTAKSPNKIRTRSRVAVSPQSFYLPPLHPLGTDQYLTVAPSLHAKKIHLSPGIFFTLPRNQMGDRLSHCTALYCKRSLPPLAPSYPLALPPSLSKYVCPHLKLCVSVSWGGDVVRVNDVDDPSGRNDGQI